MPKPNKSFFVYCIQSKEIFFYRKSYFFKVKEIGRFNKNRKECFWTSLATVIKKDPKSSLIKQANILNIHEKTEEIKQNFSPDFNSLDYAIQNILENKKNPTSHPNIS